MFYVLVVENDAGIYRVDSKEGRPKFIEPLQCGDCGQYYDPATSPFTGVCPKCFKESKREYDGVAELPEAVF